jgi:heme/copper-type cytochrome/quinol oxidase subunit 2
MMGKEVQMKKIPFIVLCLLIMGCAGQQTKALQEIPEEAPVKKVHLKGENCVWVPDLITVERGNHVILEVESIDWDYNFQLKGYDLRFVIPKGEKVTADFYASKAGEFEFGCYIEKGRYHLWGDMVGKLIVQ